jgi:[protein-PII] uridylyltransferase
MLIDLRSIDAHADRRLSDAGDPAERVRAFKAFLKIETERLRIRHRFGLGGVDIAAGRAYLVDVIVRRICALAANTAGVPLEALGDDFAALAIGGYGRGELAPHSDVDILFLHRRSAQRTQPLVEQALVLLWDAGLTVGHSFRSIAECVSMVRDDRHSRNALSEARLIAGSATLWGDLQTALAKSVYSSKRATTTHLEQIHSEWGERRERFGEVVCILEPNVKESAGGLRDVHTVIWASHARHGCRSLDDLESAGVLSSAELATLRRCYGFVSRVRNEAHFSTGRASDQLSLELQPTLAASLGYSAKRGLQASEILMREYYGQAQELMFVAEGALERLWGGDRKRRGWRAPKRLGSHAAFEIHDGKLHAREGSVPEADPVWLLHVFEAAQEGDVPLASALKLMVRDRLKLVNRAFRCSPEAAAVFLRLLRKPGRVASTLRLMHEAGFLGRFLPEFGYVTFLVQHDYYHRYTVDEHTLEVLGALDGVVESEAPELSGYADVFRQVEDPAALYLGVFLHDIGKGRGGGHVAKGVTIAERVCARLHVPQGLADAAVFLVRCHLLMSHFSQRRDLSEEQPIAELCEQVGSLERLNLLLLLTYADINGVGPGVWNAWKASLLWELYVKAKARLTASDPHAGTPGRDDVKKRALRELPPEFAASTIERHYALLPDRYRTVIDFTALQRDLRMDRQLEHAPLVAEWRSGMEKRPDDLTVCTRDAPGLLARISGTLTAHGLNILSLDLYTREDGVVFDTFTVARIGEYKPVEESRRGAVETSLKAAVEGAYDVEGHFEEWRAQARRRRKIHRPTPPSVKFDSDASPTKTVIEVCADDEPGLVYRIARALSGAGVAIRVAKIATEKSHALDFFYVTDEAGRKLSSAVMTEVEHAVIVALQTPLD